MPLPALALNAWLRWDIIERHLDRIDPPGRMLEIGAGQGAVGARLAVRGGYTGVEPDAQSRSVAAGRMPVDARLVATLDDLDPVETFDLVCAFEVLEHIDADADALRAWSERISPGGHLLLSVPSHQRRFGAWDERVGHLRRYERDALHDLLRGASLQSLAVDASGFPLGHLLERARNGIARLEGRRADSTRDRTAASGRAFQPPSWAAPLLRLTSAPFRRAQAPFRRTQLGTGWVALARRPPM